MSEPIYLDHNATTPLLPEVAEAVRKAMLAHGGNAASQHAAGRAARRTLEDCRGRIAELLGANTTGMQADRLIFTSGATEANNHALRGVLKTSAKTGSAKTGSLLTSAIEHPSVSGVAARLRAEGHVVVDLPVDKSGVTQPGGFREVLSTFLDLGAGTPDLVSVMLGNSETGVLQPVQEIAAICNEYRVSMHTDATQVVGKLPVSFQGLGVTIMSFSAHKFHGPVGIGGLLVRGDFTLPPLLAGQPGADRPGTAPVALVVGMRRALELAVEQQAERLQRVTDLRDRLERKLTSKVPGTIVIGAEAERLPHTSNIAFVGFDRQALAMALDRAGIACSTGSACASGSSEPSPVLIAMQLPEEQISGALRFSLGATTTHAEIEEAVHRISSVCKHLRERG